MQISAVIPTIGRVETLPSVLLSLKFQTQAIHEVILLDEADIPVSDSFAVSQALDLLSLSGVFVKTIRNRRRAGIAAARVALVEEAANDLVLMVDDDVVLDPKCVEKLALAIHDNCEDQIPWAVPTCVLIPKVESDGYIDRPVDSGDLNVRLWTEKYPWFVPYFQYAREIVVPLPCAGTQAMLLRKETFLAVCGNMAVLGVLPREDTYMTVKMGPGMFISSAKCYHMEHQSQKNRGEWVSSTFYRLHEAVMRNPEMFLAFMKTE